MPLLYPTEITKTVYTYTSCLHCGKPVKNSNHTRGKKRKYCIGTSCKTLHHEHLRIRVLADKALDKLLEDNKGMSLEQFLPLLTDRMLINLADHLGVWE